jgi:hypothetical protein
MKGVPNPNNSKQEAAILEGIFWLHRQRIVKLIIDLIFCQMISTSTLSFSFRKASSFDNFHFGGAPSPIKLEMVEAKFLSSVFPPVKHCYNKEG